MDDERKAGGRRMPRWLVTGFVAVQVIVPTVVLGLRAADEDVVRFAWAMFSMTP